MVSITLYRRLSSFFPKPFYNTISSLLRQGGFENLDVRTFLGFAFFTAVAAGVLAFFLSSFLVRETVFQALVGIFVAIATLGMFYIWLSMAADARAKQMEQVLPVALQMISSNIRAGMTLENAVWSSARPEFGAFKDEIKRMSADSFGGVPMSQTMSEIPKRVNSPIMERAIKLIVEGITLGGEMAKLLDEVAEDIRSTQLLQKEIAVSTTTYAIFIVFASVIAAPLLFSVSTYYAVLNEEIVKKQVASTGGQDFSKNAPSGLSGLTSLGAAGEKSASAITAADVKNFAIAAIAITCFFAALIVGLIREGKATSGLRLAPIIVIVGLAVYFGFSAILASAFASFVK